MNIDVLSDIHLDFHVTYNHMNENKLNRIFKKIFLDSKYISSEDDRSNYIIIPGDIGHYNYQNIQFLKWLKTLYNEVIVVLGNHDYYLINPYQVKKYTYSDNRINEFKELCYKHDIKLLDYNTIKIENKILAGGSAWYDGKYCMIDDTEAQLLYTKMMQDSRYIHLKDFNLKKDFISFAKHNINKMERLIEYNDPDIIVTHISPDSNLTHDKYKLQKSSAFFSYNSKQLITGKLKNKLWLYGHTHEFTEIIDGNNNLFYCNPLGYKNENMLHKPMVRTIYNI